MTEEQIKTMSEQYASEYIKMYQKVAQVAFVDGMKAAMQYMRDKLASL